MLRNNDLPLNRTHNGNQVFQGSAKVADKYQAENWGHYGGNSLYNSLNHLDYNGEDKILLDCIKFKEAFRKKVGEESKRIALYFSKPRFTLQ